MSGGAAEEGMQGEVEWLFCVSDMLGCGVLSWEPTAGLCTRAGGVLIACFLPLSFEGAKGLV